VLQTACSRATLGDERALPSRGGTDVAAQDAVKSKAPRRSVPPEQDHQGGRPGKKPAHSGGAGAQSGSTGQRGKNSPK
jgi:hypothetical protein